MQKLSSSWGTFLARGIRRLVPESSPRLLTRAVLGLYNSVWHWYRPGDSLTPEVEGNSSSRAGSRWSAASRARRAGVPERRLTVQEESVPHESRSRRSRMRPLRGHVLSKSAFAGVPSRSGARRPRQGLGVLDLPGHGVVGGAVGQERGRVPSGVASSALGRLTPSPPARPSAATAITAASRTAECATISRSTSATETFSPRRRIESLTCKQRAGSSVRVSHEDVAAVEPPVPPDGRRHFQVVQIARRDRPGTVPGDEARRATVEHGAVVLVNRSTSTSKSTARATDGPRGWETSGFELGRRRRTRRPAGRNARRTP